MSRAGLWWGGVESMASACGIKFCSDGRAGTAACQLQARSIFSSQRSRFQSLFRPREIVCWWRYSRRDLRGLICSSTRRPTLDDVERLSRGRSSKAKIGSRAVPHRLNAEERKSFELAKKRGFVVHQPHMRRYPLINSHRNYCDAVGIPCIRIDQGAAGGADEVVLDLNPLRLTESDYVELQQLLILTVDSHWPQGNDNSGQSGELEPGRESTLDSSVVQVEESDVEAMKATDIRMGALKPLCFSARSRSEAKHLTQALIEAWGCWAKSKKVVAV